MHKEARIRYVRSQANGFWVLYAHNRQDDHNLPARRIVTCSAGFAALLKVMLEETVQETGAGIRGKGHYSGKAVHRKSRSAPPINVWTLPSNS